MHPAEEEATEATAVADGEGPSAEAHQGLGAASAVEVGCTATATAWARAAGVEPPRHITTSSSSVSAGAATRARASAVSLPVLCQPLSTTNNHNNFHSSSSRCNSSSSCSSSKRLSPTRLVARTATTKTNPRPQRTHGRRRRESVREPERRGPRALVKRRTGWQLWWVKPVPCETPSTRPREPSSTTRSPTSASPGARRGASTPRIERSPTKRGTTRRRVTRSRGNGKDMKGQPGGKGDISCRRSARPT